MMTAVETKQRIEDEAKWWKIPLMDFVDDFRYYKDAAAIIEPFKLSDERKDAVLASVIETLCDELSIPIPGWLSFVPACREPYFLSQMESLNAFCLIQTPIHFRIRKVFIMENFLQRV
ncbi:MAG: hypothetical protein ABIP78_11045 [Pyrinomonadaceae bacterium]